MLAERAGPGDRDRARQLLGESAGRYRQLGMRRHQAMVERARSQP